MKLSIKFDGDQPIYEQIKLQIKEQIVSGTLAAGEMLPSIRVLAKELKVGIITAKRAYDDLTEEGFTESVAGKGVFVSRVDRKELTEAGEQELTKRLTTVIRYARANGVKKDDYDKISAKIWEDLK